MKSQSQSELPINLSPEQINGLSQFLDSDCRDYFFIKKIYVNSLGQVKAILEDEKELKYYIVTMTSPNTWKIVTYYQPIEISETETETDFKTVFKKLKDKEAKDYPVNLPPEEEGWTFIPGKILKSIPRNWETNRE